MSKIKLQSAINAVNKRYSKGLNDDDQVYKMSQIAKNTKGYYFTSHYDTYELCTDLERLLEISLKYGYWSEQVKSFNDILHNKGGWSYMNDLNSKTKELLKKEVQNIY